MYNKLIKKYSILKLFCFCMPVSKNIHKSNFYLCKYLIYKTPYGNIFFFIKELKKIMLINKNLYNNKKILFGGTTKMFLLNMKNNYVLNNNPVFLTANTLFIICGSNYTSKKIAFFKDKKMLSIGFINYNNLSHITDFTLLLNSKYFASVFLIHYFIKKILKNVNY